MIEIVCRTDRCLGCRSCELACAVEHSQLKDLVPALSETPLPKARVRVHVVSELGQGHLRMRSIALQCRHCEEPACADACIAGGIVRDREAGVVRFDPEKCVACWSCVMLCPHGVIVRVPELGCAITCDLCAGRDVPACVEACTTRALIVVHPEQVESLCREEEEISRRRE